MPEGIIIKGIGGFYYVISEKATYECRARGIFRKDGLTPLPGDRVVFSVLDEEKKVGSIDEILPRTSELIRPAVANVSQVIIVIALKSPQPDYLLVDKLLLTIEQKGLRAVICVNKTDLDPGGECEKLLNTYVNTGYDIVLTSSKTEDGMAGLKKVLAGHISVLAGQSGVGKSTILNCLTNGCMMETGEVSEKIERGKHTTRHAELFMLETGGYLVDTPGFSSYEITGLTYEELQIYYPEFRRHMHTCKFNSCSHITEPGCKVKEAVGQGHISKERYERYIELYQWLKQSKDSWKDKKLPENRKRPTVRK